jgi:hypothetical protein
VWIEVASGNFFSGSGFPACGGDDGTDTRIPDNSQEEDAMLNRRTFMETFGGAGLLAATGGFAYPAEKRRVFVLESYYLKSGTQPARIHFGACENLTGSACQK